MPNPHPPVTMTPPARGGGPNQVGGRIERSDGDGRHGIRDAFAADGVVQGVLVGALAMSTAFGLGMRDAAASTATGASCDAYYSAAMYAADRWRAANRSGDT